MKIPKGWKQVPQNSMLQPGDKVYDYPGWKAMHATSVFPLPDFTYIRRKKRKVK